MSRVTHANSWCFGGQARRERTPAETLALHIHDYNQKLYLAHRRSGLHYQTGPRAGQQLAAARKADAMLPLSEREFADQKRRAAAAARKAVR